MLSIIIPALNAEQTLAATLESCAHSGTDVEILVSDGGSTDETVVVSKRFGCRVVSGEAGRGPQLRAGGQAAAGDWLLFLHGDTRLGENWYEAVMHFTRNAANTFRAATFHLHLDDTCAQARRLEWFVAWRTRLFGLPYGDQGLLISRPFYDRLGGFSPLPIMEDVDMVRRIGRANLHLLDVPVTTSAHKYRRDGYWRRSLKNLGLMVLYRLGVSPARLVEYYR